MSEFICYKCKETFEKAWSDEEALKELSELWPGMPVEQCGILCDDCHIEFIKWHEVQQRNWKEILLNSDCMGNG